MYAVLPKDYPIDGGTGYPLSEFDGRDFIMPAQGFDKDIMLEKPGNAELLEIPVISPPIRLRYDRYP